MTADLYSNPQYVAAHREYKMAIATLKRYLISYSSVKTSSIILYYSLKNLPWNSIKYGSQNIAQVVESMLIKIQNNT